MVLFLRVISVISLIYYGIIVSYAGMKAAFSPVWLIMSAGSMMLSFFVPYMKKIPNIIQYGFLICIALGVFLFCIVEGNILYYAHQEPAQNVDYLIILGARVKGTVPSKTLKERITASIEYLDRNKGTKVIVSGGQGPGEDITEAEAMCTQLLAHGIEADRIILEDQSTNTVENIKFSKAIINNDQAEVVISTSDFHVFRGIKIAKKQGLLNVTGCPSKPDKILMVNYYFREFFAIVKDKLSDNL